MIARSCCAAMLEIRQFEDADQPAVTQLYHEALGPTGAHRGPGAGLAVERPRLCLAQETRGRYPFPKGSDLSIRSTSSPGRPSSDTRWSRAERLSSAAGRRSSRRREARLAWLRARQSAPPRVGHISISRSLARAHRLDPRPRRRAHRRACVTKAHHLETTCRRRVRVGSRASSRELRRHAKKRNRPMPETQSNTEGDFEQIADHIRELNERIIASSKQVGEATLGAYAKML
jgi:hypothetical protein